MYCLEKVALKEKGPLFIVPWRCTLACENNCVHCESAGKQVVPDELDTAAAKKIVDEISDFGATFFGVTGGQPFLRKDLFEVIGYARKQGLSTSIITDGRLMDDKAFEEIVKNKVRISISIDGAEKTNDIIRGAGAYAAAVSAIEKLSREKLLDCLVYTFANKGKVTNANEARHAPRDRFSAQVWFSLGSFPRLYPLQQRQKQASKQILRPSSTSKSATNCTI